MCKFDNAINFPSYFVPLLLFSLFFQSYLNYSLFEALFNNGHVIEASVVLFNRMLLCFQAEIQLNLQKRRGHGVLSVLQPKFSGVLGEALDVAARWSGDVVSA